MFIFQLAQKTNKGEFVPAGLITNTPEFYVKRAYESIANPTNDRFIPTFATEDFTNFASKRLVEFVNAKKEKDPNAGVRGVYFKDIVAQVRKSHKEWEVLNTPKAVPKTPQPAPQLTDVVDEIPLVPLRSRKLATVPQKQENVQTFREWSSALSYFNTKAKDTEFNGLTILAIRSEVYNQFIGDGSIKSTDIDKFLKPAENQLASKTE